MLKQHACIRFFLCVCICSYRYIIIFLLLFDFDLKVYIYIYIYLYMGRACESDGHRVNESDSEEVLVSVFAP